MLKQFLKTLSVMWLAILPLVAEAQTPQKTTEQQDTLSLPFMKRFSIRTNAVDWMMVTPNLGLELDLSGTPKTHYSVLVNGKWNWNTSHTVAPRFIYNVAAGTVEARKYWRTGGKWAGHALQPFSFKTSEELYEKEISGKVGRDTTVSLPRWAFQVFRRNVLSGRTFREARTWRAYYAGVYAGYEKYTIAFGRKGKQGDSYNFGFTGGWSVPLYFFRDGRSVDLDLGLALGAKMTQYDEFSYEEETGCYAYEGTRSRHIVPYPVIQDLHVSLIFRFRSIGKKVKGGFERYEKWYNEVYEKKKYIRDTTRNSNWYKAYGARMAKLKEQERDSLHNDSIKQKFREKQQLDSIQDAAKDAQMKKMKEAARKASGKKEKASRKKDKKKGSEAEEAAVGASGQEKKAAEEKKEKKSRKRKKKDDDASEARNTGMEDRQKRNLASLNGREAGRKEVAQA